MGGVSPNYRRTSFFRDSVQGVDASYWLTELTPRGVENKAKIFQYLTSLDTSRMLDHQRELVLGLIARSKICDCVPDSDEMNALTRAVDYVNSVWNSETGCQRQPTPPVIWPGDEK